MNVQRFIDRPILSIVISATILLIGFIGLSSLPVEQYPDIAPPTLPIPVPMRRLFRNQSLYLWKKVSTVWRT